MSQTGKREDGKPLQPYKFLDPHTLQDKTIFFGRGQEIEILLADIVVNRLVVLFARTGMGKTSLIQAGVWPRLVDLGYKPVYLPTGGNPTESAIEALTKEGLLPQSLAKESWATHLMRGRGQGRLQIVLFFDQFEMFFNQVRKREDRRQFISDIAAIYHSRGSGIHIVFSMREEYYHHMDDFRDQIPSIFNRGSSLRLRPLTPEQAEEAIVGPAKLFDLQVEPELVERLKRDLAEEEGIEPARLEIVCNTLWRESRRPQNDGVPLLDLYKELGHGIGNPADRIYNRRLEEDIDGNLEDRQLELFEKLLPMLRTTRDTKYPRDLGELEDSLKTDRKSLDELVGRLKETGLLRDGMFPGTVEWTSDYLALAERTEHLQERVKTIALWRRVRAARERAEAKTTELTQERGLKSWVETATLDELEILYIAPAEFEAISQGAHLLKQSRRLDREDLYFLFDAALYHGTHMRVWFEQADEEGIDAWPIVGATIGDEHSRFEQAHNAVRLLGELGTDEAIELLERALEQDTLVSPAITALAGIPRAKATAVLERALQQETLALPATDELSRLQSREAIELLAITLRKGGAFALPAGAALYGIAAGRPSAASERAGEQFADAMAGQAEALFLEALTRGRDLGFWFEQASERGVDVWGILRTKITSPGSAVEQAHNAVRLLGELGSEQAIELLRLALGQDALVLDAGSALRRIASDRSGEASSEASEALTGALAQVAEPLFQQALEQGFDTRFWFEHARDNGVDVWAILGKKVTGKKVPVKQAETAVRLLVELGGAQAEKLLRAALARGGDLGYRTLSALADAGTAQAVELLESALEQEELASRAEMALDTLARSGRADTAIRAQARKALDRWRARQELSYPEPPPQVAREPAGRPAPSAARRSAVGRGRDASVDRDWQALLRRIRNGQCTPILGPGVTYPSLPLGSEIARSWAARYGYPFEDDDDLARVADFVAVQRDPLAPKEEYVLQVLKDARPPDFDEPDEPHALLADLPLPIYLTTNYDDFMMRALQSRGKEPKRELFAWNRYMEHSSASGADWEIEPTLNRPVVFHLHGHDKHPESLVLTESDYLDFLVNSSRDQYGLPPRIQRALASTSLLLLGYSWEGWDWRTLFHGVLRWTEASLRRVSFVVQLLPAADAAESTERMAAYLASYYDALQIRVYWGTLRDFARELRERWEDFLDGG